MSRSRATRAASSGGPSRKQNHLIFYGNPIKFSDGQTTKDEKIPSYYETANFSQTRRPRRHRGTGGKSAARSVAPDGTLTRQGGRESKHPGNTGRSTAVPAGPVQPAADGPGGTEPGKIATAVRQLQQLLQRLKRLLSIEGRSADGAL